MMFFVWLIPLLLLAGLASPKEFRPSGSAIALIGGLLLLPLLFMGTFGGFPFGPGFGMMGSHGPWFGSGYSASAFRSGFDWGGLILGLVVLAALGLFIYYVTKRLPGPSDPALDELRTRLAKGEISSQEFDELRQKLQS